MIRFTKPTLPAYELVEPYIKDIFNTGMVTTGKYSEELEMRLGVYSGVKALSTSSCSVGMNILLSTLPKWTKVIIPAFTFIATWEACAWNNLKPVIVDVDERGLIDPERVRSVIDSKTSAVLGVHMFGQSAYSQRLSDICSRHGAKLFFDGAHAMGSIYRGRPLVSYGDACVVSFGATKPLCNGGEGGAIFTPKEQLLEELKWKRQHGHKGDLDSFTKGTNGRPVEILSAIAIENLKEFDIDIARRCRIYVRYFNRLKERFKIIPVMTDDDTSSIIYFVIVCKNWNQREELYHKLQRKEIGCKRYFHPSLHKVKLMSKYSKNKYPVAERLANTCLAIPFHTGLTDEEIETVCKILTE